MNTEAIKGKGKEKDKQCYFLSFHFIPPIHNNLVGAIFHAMNIQERENHKT